MGLLIDGIGSCGGLAHGYATLRLPDLMRDRGPTRREKDHRQVGCVACNVAKSGYVQVIDTTERGNDSSGGRYDAHDR